MQLVRKREHAAIVGEFLRTVPRSKVFITDFALHSIMILMKRHGQLNDFPTFARELGLNNDSMVVGIPTHQLPAIIPVVQSFRLDLDDAYQYAAAELHNLNLISLDVDFDRTPRGRLTPEHALQQFRDEEKKL